MGQRDRIYVTFYSYNTLNFIVFNHRVAYVDEEPRAEMEHAAQTGFASLWYHSELLHRIALSVVQTEEAFKVKAEVPQL